MLFRSPLPLPPPLWCRGHSRPSQEQSATLRNLSVPVRRWGQLCRREAALVGPRLPRPDQVIVRQGPGVWEEEERSNSKQRSRPWRGRAPADIACCPCRETNLPQRIQAPFNQGLAARQTLDGHPCTAAEAIALDGLMGILRARRDESTSRRQQGR